MSNILIFGTNTAPGVPQDMINWFFEYNKQGHKFIVSDKKGFDCSLHRALSSIGASENTTIYCMDKPNNNDYDLKHKDFLTFYDADKKEITIKASDDSIEPYVIEGVEKEQDIPFNRQWYEFRDRQMIEDCDIAFCILNGENKTVLHMIQLLNISNKPCHCINLA